MRVFAFIRWLNLFFPFSYICLQRVARVVFDFVRYLCAFFSSHFQASLSYAVYLLMLYLVRANVLIMLFLHRSLSFSLSLTHTLLTLDVLMLISILIFVIAFNINWFCGFLIDSRPIELTTYILILALQFYFEYRTI